MVDSTGSDTIELRGMGRIFEPECFGAISHFQKDLDLGPALLIQIKMRHTGHAGDQYKATSHTTLLL